MRALAEGEMVVGLARNVESVRVGELGRVAKANEDPMTAVTSKTHQRRLMMRKKSTIRTENLESPGRNGRSIAELMNRNCHEV
mgnify:CR=1 FL=1